MDRLNKKEIAIIGTFNRQENNLKDVDSSGTPDILEVSRLTQEESIANSNFNIQLQKLSNDRAKLAQERSSQIEQIKLEKEKLRVKEREIKSKEKIARENKTASEIRAKKGK